MDETQIERLCQQSAPKLEALRARLRSFSSALVAFSASFGPGFYWFAAYCLFSLASQQITHALDRAE